MDRLAKFKGTEPKRVVYRIVSGGIATVNIYEESELFYVYQETGPNSYFSGIYRSKKFTTYPDLEAVRVELVKRAMDTIKRAERDIASADKRLALMADNKPTLALLSKVASRDRH